MKSPLFSGLALILALGVRALFAQEGGGVAPMAATGADLSAPPANFPAGTNPVVVPETVEGAQQEGDLSSARPRDPFWPVGYLPKVVKKPVVVAKPAVDLKSLAGPTSPSLLWDEARKRLDVRGISLIGRDKTTGRPKYLAMVAGKLVEEGDIVSASYEGTVYRWRVGSISGGGVAFKKLDTHAE